MEGDFKMTDMFTLADRLKELRERKAELAEETKANNTEIEKTELELSQLMAQTETQSFQRAGTLFYLATKTYASANKEQKDELFDALRYLLRRHQCSAPDRRFFRRDRDGTVHRSKNHPRYSDRHPRHALATVGNRHPVSHPGSAFCENSSGNSPGDGV